MKAANATEARRITEKNRCVYTNFYIETLGDRIDSAIRSGQFSISEEITGNITTAEVKKYFTNLGYAVSTCNGSIIISW